MYRLLVFQDGDINSKDNTLMCCQKQGTGCFLSSTENVTVVMYLPWVLADKEKTGQDMLLLSVVAAL